MKPFSAGLVISFLVAAVSSNAQSGGSWKELAPMPTARQEIATAVLNGKIYVMGGYDVDGQSTATVEVYDPASDTWSSAHSLPSMTNHSAAAVAAGRLYSINGGLTHVYDQATDSWSQVATTHSAHGLTPAVGVFEDKIYLAGGRAASSSRELEVYDPATNTWTVRAPMSVARNHTGGGVIDGKFYVVAGRGSANAENALEVYDPATNTWASRAPLPTGRSGVGVAVVNGELLVFGGETPGFHSEVEAYNPTTNTWRSLTPMTHPRHGIWASVIGNKVYVAGGGEGPGFAASSRNDVFIVDHKATFANIATRLKVGTGDNVLIGGFIVTGTGSKRIMLRAVGPSLPLSGALANPRLEFYNGTGQLIAANDNWQEAPNRQEIIDSSIAPSNNLEAAILTTVTPGNFTAIVRGEGDSTGVALVEVYDLEAGSASSLANISTRGFVQRDNDVLIAGMIFDGQIPRRIMARAIGPSLGRPDALADPMLELRDANGGLVAENDNWRSAQESEIIGTSIPPPNNLEAAIVKTLPPARYTAIVQGKNGGTGIALVEAYALD